MRRIFAVIWFAVVVSTAMAADTASHVSASPAATVQAFYTYHFGHEMGFTEPSVQAKAAWLAPELLDRCLAYLKKPVPADEVPDIDGDPFTDSQEYPKSFKVGHAKISGTTAQVPVVLSWPGRRRTITVQLRAIHGVWRITDFQCEGGRSLRGLVSPGTTE